MALKIPSRRTTVLVMFREKAVEREYDMAELAELGSEAQTYTNLTLDMVRILKE